MLQAGSLAKALPHSRPQLCHLGWQRMIRARAQGLSVHRLLQWQQETHRVLSSQALMHMGGGGPLEISESGLPGLDHMYLPNPVHT